MTPRRRRRATMALAIGLMAGAMIGGAGPSSAAPVGSVDAGVPFSSVVYGTGCSYPLTVDVNSVGTVSFYEQRRGYPPVLIGRAPAYQLSATVTWVPRRQGNRILYAVQNGQRSAEVIARVHQGYGSRGLCFAL